MDVALGPHFLCAGVDIISTFTGGNNFTGFVVMLTLHFPLAVLRGPVSGPVVHCIDYSHCYCFNVMAS